MLRGGYELAEHDRVRTTGDQRLERLRYGLQFWVWLLGQSLGLRHQLCQRAIRFESGSGLDVYRIGLICIVIKYLFFQSIWIGSETIAKGARSCGWRRTNTAHQCERTPEGKPTVALVGAGALHYTQAVIEHGIVE